MRLFGRRVADRLYQCYHAVVGQRHRCGEFVAVDHGPYDCRERFGGTEEIDVLCNESRIGIRGGYEFVGCLARDELFAAYVYYVYRGVGYEWFFGSSRLSKSRDECRLASASIRGIPPVRCGAGRSISCAASTVAKSTASSVVTVFFIYRFITRVVYVLSFRRLSYVCHLRKS